MGSEERKAPVLRHIDLPPGPGTRVVLTVPAGHEWLDDADPLVPGCGFTLILGDYGRWRSEVRFASRVRDEVGMELEITGRYAEDLGEDQATREITQATSLLNCLRSTDTSRGSTSACHARNAARSEAPNFFSVAE